MNKDLFLTNSLGNKKEKFVPINKNKIGMYVCGPTVYDDPHIGNARPLVVFDILYKVLKCKYGDKSVSYIRNITDVDDKIIKAEPTDGLWDDGRTDTGQLGLEYNELEEAMKNPNSKNREKYEKIRKLNLHKMDPIPVCKIPN